MIKINKSIRRDGMADERDIDRVKHRLREKGYYEEPDYGMTPYPDNQMFDAIENFQKGRSLRIDGVINPEGETIDALNDLISNKAPILRCTNCGAPHGGVAGDQCTDCAVK